MEKRGPEWHLSAEKQALEARLLGVAKHLIALELNYCMAIGELTGKDIFVQDRVDTLDLESGIITNLPVLKMQTLERTDLPLGDGKKQEQTLTPIIDHFRQTAGDEALQILQATWDVARPGRLALISTRPQMTDEFSHMGALMADAGYYSMFLGYVARYNAMRKAYMSNESFIGFSHQRDSLDRYVERCELNEKYFLEGSAKTDVEIFMRFIFGGIQVRSGYTGNKDIVLRNNTEVAVYQQLSTILD
jgi:hypothetical protein